MGQLHVLDDKRVLWKKYFTKKKYNISYNKKNTRQSVLPIFSFLQEFPVAQRRLKISPKVGLNCVITINFIKLYS